MNTKKKMTRKPHLTKEQRLPRSYKDVLKILKTVKSCEANIKTALHNAKLPQKVIARVYALAVNVLKRSQLLDAIIQEIKLFEKEPFLRKEVAELLIYELIFGKGLQGESKQVMTLKKYQYEIDTAYQNLQDKFTVNGPVFSIPKYVRVNTLITTMDHVLKDLEYIGLQQIFYEETVSETEYFDLVKNLKCGSFLIDYHFKDLLVFPNEENLSSWSWYQNGYVFIQDKSSYIPVHVLNPGPGSTVLDACAAPGMKTLHLTSMMQNKGVLYAFEKDEPRFKILESMLQSGQANICQTFCEDFSSVDVSDEKFSSVECILLDPSCSGSGMVSRMDSVTDTEDSKNIFRLKKLAGFQIVLLKHALSFPSVKRIVYSTCSITETENEYVVQEALSHFSQRFKLVEVLPNWPIRGSDKYDFGALCLRAYPDKCLTNGFFVAMFERIDFPNEQISNSFKKKSRKRRKELVNNHEASQQDYHCKKNFCNTGDFENQIFDQDSLVNNEYYSHNEETAPPKKIRKKKLENNEVFESNNTKQDFLYIDKNKSLSENACSEKIQTSRSKIFLNELENGQNGNEVSQQLKSDETVRKTHKRKRKHSEEEEDNFQDANVGLDCVEKSVEIVIKKHKNKHKRSKKEKADFQDENIGLDVENSDEIVMKNHRNKHKHSKERKFDFQDANKGLDDIEKCDKTVVKKHKRKRKHSEEEKGDFQDADISLDNVIKSDETVIKKRKHKHKHSKKE